MSWPKVELRGVMSLDLDRVAVDPTTTYEMVGVYSFGRGLFRREPVFGAKTSYKFFYRLKAEHVVMSQLFGWEGALALSSSEYDGHYVSPQFPTFLCDRNRLDRQFLGWLMRRPGFWEDLGTRTKGMGDRRRTLNPEALLTTIIPLPPLSEQQRIVARIEELAAKIEEAKRVRHHAADKADTLIDAMLDKIFASVTEKAKIVIIGGDGGFVTSGPRGWGDYYSQNGDRRLIRVENVTDRELNLSTASRVSVPPNAGDLERSQVEVGDVLVTITGAIGRVGVVREFDLPCHVSQHVALVRPPAAVLSDYLYWYLRSPSFGRSQTEGKTYGATKPGINLTSLRTLEVATPPHDEQCRIVAYVNNLQTSVNALKRLQAETAAELDALLPSILDKAFRGEL